MKDAVQKTDIYFTCPDSQWGDSSFCTVHQKKILEITSCQQWGVKLYTESNGQISMHDPTQLIDIIQKTEDVMKSLKKAF